METNSSMVSIKKEDLDFMISMLTKVRDDEVLTEADSARLQDIRSSTVSTSRSHSIRAVLKQLGVRPGIRGYDYLQTAIDLVLDDRTLIQNITKELYPAIAKAHNTTASRTERAIRHAVEVAFDSYGDETLRNEIFGNSVGSNKGKPTNTLFIACVTEYLSE